MSCFGRFKIIAGIIILIIVLVQINLLLKSGRIDSDSPPSTSPTAWRTNKQNFNILAEQKQNTMSPDNEELVDLVRTTLMVPPSQGPYSLTSAKENPSQGHIQHIRDILIRFKNGTFVECNAHDGEHNSDTIWLEKRLGWSGLLIEPDLDTFELLRSKNRKAWLANACLSTKPYPEQIDLVYRNNSSMGNSDGNKVTVQCVPLETLLLAAGLTKIDFFSLNVEGFELEVLKGIPFDKIPIKIFVIEYFHIGINATEEVHKLMTKSSYNLHYNQTSAKNLFYIHSNLNI